MAKQMFLEGEPVTMRTPAWDGRERGRETSSLQEAWRQGEGPEQRKKEGPSASGRMRDSCGAQWAEGEDTGQPKASPA